MATSDERTDKLSPKWDRLRAHPNFLRLKENSKQVTPRTDPQELLAAREEILILWNRGKKRLSTNNLKYRQNKEGRKQQVLLCSKAPTFNVEHITLSSTGNHVLLWGPHGASVMHLPERYGEFNQYENGKEEIKCRTEVLAEELFKSSDSIRLLRAAWHPGSNSDLHVVLLTSDNTLRIYDIKSPDKPIKCPRLGKYVVAFDFGPATEDSRRATERHSGCSPLVYPIYILKGNGDVLLLQTSLSEPGYLHVDTNLQGPLTMHPPAEDNDACSLICMHSNPVVLVVATLSGILHHCVVLTGGDDDDADDGNDNDSMASGSSSDLASVRKKTDSSLHVYESKKLMVTPVFSEGCIEEFVHPILLYKDPHAQFKYYCSHSAGAHNVTLPCNEEGTVINQDQPCTVEHTYDNSESSFPAPILGLSVVKFNMQLHGKAMVCLFIGRDGFDECIVTWENVLVNFDPLLSTA